MRRPRHALLIAAFATLGTLAGGACADLTSSPPLPDLPELPDQLRLIATAEGNVAGLDISCRVDLILVIEPNGTHHLGNGGGDAQRSVLDESGAGVAFWADAIYRVRINHGTGGSLDITSIEEDGDPMPPDSESRFWDEILAWSGTVGDGDILGTGSWTCAPMDARDDTVGSIVGSWTLAPL